MDFFKELNFEQFNFLEIATRGARIIIVLIVGFFVIRLLKLSVRKVLSSTLSKQSTELLTKSIHYIGFGFILFYIFSELGIKISALLGAAGVLGIVLGIASQASIGNIISGLFLVSDKAFEVGDFIRVGDKSGIVYSIDLLSIKLRTLDNMLIRIPNQTMISAEILNITKFPIRRMDIVFEVAYKTHLPKVKDVLHSIVAGNHLCLNSPEPLIVFDNFMASGISVKFGVWFEKSNFVKVKNQVVSDILEKFRENDIEIPFPHISVYKGSETDAFPVDVQSNTIDEDKEKGQSLKE